MLAYKEGGLSLAMLHRAEGWQHGGSRVAAGWQQGGLHELVLILTKAHQAGPSHSRVFS
jgi:hypothetical protein